MTVFMCDGFETYGNLSTLGSDIETRLGNTDKISFVEISGGHTGNLSLINDFESVGLAVEFPSVQAGRSEWIRYEFPDGSGRFPDYKLPTNASHPTMCVGFRFYNADTTPNLQSTIWSCLTGSGSGAASLRRATNKVDLEFLPASGTNTVMSGALSLDTWHYIEIEFKFAPSSAGGFAKVYVDGSEVADITSANMAPFTFNTGYGFEIGCSASTSQTAGNNFAFDDVYAMEIDGVNHTAPLGPSRVLLLGPASDDAPNDWTPSGGGSNYPMVDGTDWDTTTYVEATTNGDDDHYGLDTLGPQDEVHGASISVVCEAVDGTPNLHIGFDNGTADEEDMGTIPSASGEVQKRMFFEADPSGSAWSVANLNSAEATQRMVE